MVFYIAAEISHFAMTVFPMGSHHTVILLIRVLKVISSRFRKGSSSLRRHIMCDYVIKFT
ncbi:hypothetical protein BDR03DRAFT_960997 [Suillus americanus]|nr:hypothetical protein BDR03DRAFT_960997 [Suillus americanus]